MTNKEKKIELSACCGANPFDDGTFSTITMTHTFDFKCSKCKKEFIPQSKEKVLQALDSKEE